MKTVRKAFQAEMRSEMPDDILMKLAEDVARLKREIELMKTSRPQVQIWSTNVLYPSGSQNNYDVGYYTYVAISSAVPINITGISNGTLGRVLILTAAAVGTITLPHQSASSLAQNRFYNTNGSSVVLGTVGDAAGYIWWATTVGWLQIFTSV